MTGQPGKTTHSTGLTCDSTELFCSKWFIFQVFLCFLAASFLTSVSTMEHPTPDGNLTHQMEKLPTQSHATESELVLGLFVDSGCVALVVKQALLDFIVPSFISSKNLLFKKYSRKWEGVGGSSITG